jgi:arabinofuranan 3-O-arabinosyltransferase
MIVHDEGRLTVRDVLRKRAHYGSSLPAFAAANRGAVGAQARATARAFYRHRRDLAADPAHGAGLIALRALEAGGYAWGAARARLARRP